MLQPTEKQYKRVQRTTNNQTTSDTKRRITVNTKESVKDRERQTQKRTQHRAQAGLEHVQAAKEKGHTLRQQELSRACTNNNNVGRETQTT